MYQKRFRPSLTTIFFSANTEIRRVEQGNNAARSRQVAWCAKTTSGNRRYVMGGKQIVSVGFPTQTVSGRPDHREETGSTRLRVANQLSSSTSGNWREKAPPERGKVFPLENANAIARRRPRPGGR
jgi:hypothetical protein